MSAPIWLSLETTAPSGSVALRVGEQIVERHFEGTGAMMSERILPTIQALCHDHSITLKDCTTIICTQGPGPFTAIRLAIAVTQGLAYHHQMTCVPVPSLLNLAYQAWCAAGQPEGEICSVIDARMGEVYWASYRFVNDRIQIGHAPALASAANFQVPSSMRLCGHGIPQLIGTTQDDATQIRWPTAKAQLELALRFDLPRLAAENIEPLYVRDQVAQTLQQRQVKVS